MGKHLHSGFQNAEDVFRAINAGEMKSRVDSHILNPNKPNQFPIRGPSHALAQSRDKNVPRGTGSTISDFWANGAYLVDDGRASFIRQLSKLVGLGQDIVAKYPETFNSPAFKSWFAKSKVVNENGDPLILYHSTTVEFDSFDPSIADIGAHFGSTRAATERAKHLVKSTFEFHQAMVGRVLFQGPPKNQPVL